VDKMNDDKDAKRMERSEIVLKKFGLLDADFHLRPFLVQLLDEQIAAFYDSKTKTVNLLDWIDPATQKPVLAHELTHALQDQRVNLDKWENQTSDDLSKNFADDRKHVATDEDDTAREAVTEGQAMAVFVDYSLQPIHQTLRSAPEMIEKMLEGMTDDSDSPVLTRAPLLLQESLLFPYKDGLKFEAKLMTDSKDPAVPFAGVLDRPPDTSFEIMNPRAYEHQVKVPVLHMPDIHPIIDADYNPYDIGVMGELDVRILAELFGGNQASAELTPEWDGGLYYAAQKKDAPDKDATSSVSLLYLSQWKTTDAAEDFVKMYANEVGHKYKHVTRDTAAETSQDEQIYRTNAHRHQRDRRVYQRELRPEHGAQAAVADAGSAAGERRPGGRPPHRARERPDGRDGALYGRLRHDEGRSAAPLRANPSGNCESAWPQDEQGHAPRHLYW
jgi:hypothetical protein